MKNSSKTSGLFERTRAAAKLALALLLVMTMVVYVPPSPSSQAYAYDGPVGSIKYGGKKIEYDEYAELEHDLENLANEEVTVEMYCDWSPDTVGMKSGLHIPVGARVTLNMNGHLFDRGSTGKEAKDPCVQVHSGATLTVNGGDRSYEHDVLAYTSLSGDTKGAVPEYTGATPTKDATAEKTFTFAGWDVKPSAIAGDTTYTATYAEQTRTYTVEFVDDDGSLLQCDDVAYGETPVYTGGTPTKTATAQYTYAFAGWTPEIDRVSDDATYTATYTNTLRKYTVAFVNDDGTVLQESELAYGETPEYTGATPTKAATAELVYVFKGWDQEITDVTGDATYKATYIEVPYSDKDYCAEGFGTTWTKGSGDSLRLTFKRIEDDDQTFNRFAGILVDGQSVAEGTSNYTVAKGSAIISLQPSYLETLSVGQHVMKAVFDDGEAQASFEVKAGSSNSDKADSGSAGSSSAATKPSSSNAAKTDDPLAALSAIAVTLAVASACCLVFVGYARRRRE